MRIRIDQNANYRGIFFNGKTIRQKLNFNKPITAPTYAEIEDVAINSKCLAGCSYCYTSALKTGSNFESIVDKALDVWGSRNLNDRPFQIAIGGAGESTMHPDWIEFVKVVKSLEIVPNYTTNGMHLSDSILEATEKYCGGVAISYHPHIKNTFTKAIEKLSGIKTKLNTHLIIGDSKSLDDTKWILDEYYDKLDYLVMLPYQAVGRGKEIETEQTWKEMFSWVNTLPIDIKNKFAFGALFYPFLLNNKVELEIDMYEPEMYSGYRMFDDSYKKLRNSSYDLKFKD